MVPAILQMSPGSYQSEQPCVKRGVERARLGQRAPSQFTEREISAPQEARRDAANALVSGRNTG
jgi:hypothetical protein